MEVQTRIHELGFLGLKDAGLGFWGCRLLKGL